MDHRDARFDGAGRHTLMPSSRPPGQSRAPLAGGDWEDVAGSKVDPSRAYEFKAPSGKSIALFFYDGPISQAVAFEKLLHNGEEFANGSWAPFRAIALDPTDAHRHRRRNLRPSPPASAKWRWRMRSIASSRRSWQRSPTTANTWRRIRPTHEAQNLREHLLELRAWRGALAQQLRLQCRAPPAGTRNGGAAA